MNGQRRKRPKKETYKCTHTAYSPEGIGAGAEVDCCAEIWYIFYYL